VVIRTYELVFEYDDEEVETLIQNLKAESVYPLSFRSLNSTEWRDTGNTAYKVTRGIR
jgi:hypothetical protein